MKNHDANRHPGPLRVMSVDSETAGILVAVGFLAMGLVSIPVARWFVLGCLALGGVFAVLLRFAPKGVIRPIVGAVIVLIVVVLWWAGHVPRRPHGVSSNAVYALPNNVRLGLFQTGYWFECWFDQHQNADRCKLTDKNGNSVFEDVFVTCGSQATIPQSELVTIPQSELLKGETGPTWIQYERVNVPIVYVRYGQTLLPRSLLAAAKQQGYCSD